MSVEISKNLSQRFFAAIALLPVVIGAIAMGGYWFTAFLALGGILMMQEWLNMTKVPDLPIRIACFCFALTAVFFAHMVTGVPGMTIILLAMAVPLSLVVVSLQHYDGTESRGLHIARWAGNGTLYVALPLVALGWMRGLPDGAILVFWTFLSVWATDVGGYFFGKGIGGPKLAPKISPKKTWAGFLGGAFLSVVVSVVLALIMSWGNLALIALIGFAVATVAQIGDLFESSIKRAFDVKDSGELIPGHGGILDRVDGLVFAAPVMAGLLDYFPVI